MTGRVYRHDSCEAITIPANYVAAANVIIFYYFNVHSQTHLHEGFHLQNTEKPNHNKLLVAVVNMYGPPWEKLAILPNTKMRNRNQKENV